MHRCCQRAACSTICHLSAAPAATCRGGIRIGLCPHHPQPVAVQVLILTQQVSTFLLARVSRAPDGVLTPSGSDNLDSPRSSGLPGTASPTADGIEGAASAASSLPESLRGPQDRASPTGVQQGTFARLSHLAWTAVLQTACLKRLCFGAATHTVLTRWGRPQRS